MTTGHQVLSFRRQRVTADLAQRAAKLFPDSDYLQREWMRAVAVVRGSRRGWLLDRKVGRAA